MYFFGILVQIKNITFILLLGFGLLRSTYLHSQSVKFVHLTSKDGLSQNSVVDIVQDKHGFIWLATQDGLNRYDGTHVKQYQKYFRDITRPTFSQLGKLYLDRENRLWLTTLTGSLQYMDIAKESFQVVDAVKNVSTIAQDSNYFWAGTYGQGIYKIYPFDSLRSPVQYLSDLNIYDISVFNQQVLVATDKGVYEKELNDIHFALKWPELSKISISSLDYNNGIISIGTHGNGLYISSDGHTIRQSPDIPDNSVIHDLHTAYNQDLWVATFGNGAYQITSDSTYHFVFNPRDNYSLNYNDVLCLTEDKNRNIWLGTDGAGVSIFNKRLQTIKRISKNQISSEYPVDVPRAIETDHEGNLWIGTSGRGLTILSKNQQYKRNYSTSSHPRILSDRVVSLKRKDNKMWIGYQGGGIQWIDLETHKIEEIDILSDIRTVWDMDFDSKGNLWMATRDNGLVYLNLTLNSTKKFNRENYKKILSSDNIRVIQISSEDELFFGSEDGKIYYLTGDHRYLKELELNNTGDIGPIKSLYLNEAQNVLWIGTQRLGVIIYDLQTKVQHYIQTKDGLPNNTIYAILPDDDGNLWVSTNQGICQIHPDAITNDSLSYVLQSFTTEDGLVSNEFNTGAHHIDDQRNLYFGGLDGVNWFSPSEMFNTPTDDKIILLELTGIFANKKEIFSLYNCSEIQLSFRQKDFQISYSIAGFPEGKKIFEYRLLDFQEDWRQNEQSNIVQFTNVPSGSYRFELRSVDLNKRWTNKEVTLDIYIAYPWWNQWWSKAGVLLILISLIIWAYTSRINFVRKKELNKYAVQKQLNDLELQVLRAQMNPHFMFNSLNTIKNYILKSQPQQAAEYLSNFSHLIRLILQNSREKSISLKEEIETLFLYIELEKMRFRDGFSFNSFIDKNINLNSIFIPPLLLQPFIENAIWHGLLHKDSDRQLSLNITKEGKHVDIIIEDNGVGRKKAEEEKSKTATRYKSLGIGITRDRINLTNKMEQNEISVTIEDLMDTIGQAAGTRVIIRITLTEMTEFEIHNNVFN